MTDLTSNARLTFCLDELYGIADGLGMDVDDPDETLTTGFIPGSPWKAPQSEPGTLELQLISHQGVSATFSDGMTSGALRGGSRCRGRD